MLCSREYNKASQSDPANSLDFFLKKVAPICATVAWGIMHYGQ